MMIHDPGNIQERIDQIWCWVSVDEGGEGVIAAPFPNIGMMPLIAADEARLNSLRPIVESIVRITGKSARLVKFSLREEIEEISGKGD
jgi:hypothetical protein